jgi:hypothetical protein
MDNQQPQQPVTPPAPQPEPQPQPQQQPNQQPVNQTDPGKTLGIVGFIFAFVGLQVFGLILSILGFTKSKKAGIKNSLALAGIIVNSVFLLLAIAVSLLFIVTLVSYGGISDRANASSAQSAAASTVRWTELHSIDANGYPKSFMELENSDRVPTTSTVQPSATPLTSEPTYPDTIEFNVCGDEGNKIGYWNYTENQVAYMYSGSANSGSSCTFVAS